MTRGEGPGRLALLLGMDENRVVVFEDGKAESRICGLLGGGYVDVLRLAPGLDMWVDERWQGMWYDPEDPFGGIVNTAATFLARAHGFEGVYCHGPALVCGVDEEGDSVGLTNLQVYGATARIPQVAFSAERITFPAATED